MDEEDDGAVDINLFGISQKAAEDENFEDVNMNAEGVTGINLFGIGDDEPSDENNDAMDEKNLDQLRQPGTGSDSNDASATDGAQVAATVTATPSDSVASGPLPIPPKAKPGEKVDTSQLDAELAKMKPTDSPQSKQPTANASAASDADDDAAADASNEDADASAASDADDDAAADASNEDADASAASDAD
ncbi:MAG: hypothetical protein LBD60_00565, partial [Puniceicoccales bacterium]|nr:hypothetical protein [Puniceicoccales bacterium]